MEEVIKKEPHPARSAARIDKCRRETDSLNIDKSESVSNQLEPECCYLARRDAAAMVEMLNKLRSGLDPYESIYQSLKKLHGKPFEDAFRRELINAGGSNGCS